MAMKVIVFGSAEEQGGKYALFNVGLPDTQDEVPLGQTGTVEVRRRGVGDVRQHGKLSAVGTLPTNPEGSVPCGRAEPVNVIE